MADLIVDTAIAMQASRIATLEASIPEWLCDKCRRIHPAAGFCNCGALLRPSTFNERRLEERIATENGRGPRFRRDAARLERGGRLNF